MKDSIPPADRCYVVTSLDLLNGTADACKTCLGVECESSLEICLNSANDQAYIELCYLQNTYDVCRERCSESCSAETQDDVDSPDQIGDNTTGDGGGGKYRNITTTRQWRLQISLYTLRSDLENIISLKSYPSHIFRNRPSFQNLYREILQLSRGV